MAIESEKPLGKFIKVNGVTIPTAETIFDETFGIPPRSSEKLKKQGLQQKPDSEGK